MVDENNAKQPVPYTNEDRENLKTIKQKLDNSEARSLSRFEFSIGLAFIGVALTLSLASLASGGLRESMGNWQLLVITSIILIGGIRLIVGPIRENIETQTKGKYNLFIYIGTVLATYAPWLPKDQSDALNITRNSLSILGLLLFMAGLVLASRTKKSAANGSKGGGQTMSRIKKIFSNNRVTVVISRLRRDPSTLITAIFWACVIVGILAFTATSKPDKIFEAGILAVALFALLIASVQLSLMRGDFNARVRPFVSVSGMQELKREDDTKACFSLNLRNTGIVPAKSVQANVLLINTETWANEQVMSQNLPLIVPNQEIPIFIFLVKSKLNEIFDTGVYNLELNFEYKGDDKTYETKQSFKMITHDQLLGLMPTEPSHAT